MSTGEFIRVLEKGEVNIPAAVILCHKDFGGKAFQRERLWDVRGVETRHQQSQLNHTNNPYSASPLSQLSISADEHTNTDFFNGSVHSNEASSSGDIELDKSPDTPPSQFSSAFRHHHHHHHHTSAEQDRAAPGVEFRECSPTGVREPYTTTGVTKEEPLQNNRLDGQLARHTAEEEVPSHLENEREASTQSESASGSHPFAQDLTDGTQEPVTLKRLREPEAPPAQNKARVIHVKVTKFLVSGNQKKQGPTNTDEQNGSGEKVSSGGRPIVCKLLELKEETLIPYSQSPDSNSNSNSNSAADLEHSCEVDSPPDMFTSSVMTALVPNWSSRSKKQRPGGGDVSGNSNPAGQEVKRRGQEVPTPLSLFARHVAQQPISGEPKPQTGDVFPGLSNKENAHSMSTSGSSIGSLTGSNLFNLRNREPAKQRVSRAYSAGMTGGKADVKTEPAHPLTSLGDTVLRPVSPHSQDLRWSRTDGQTATNPFSADMNSSSPTPTTGSLLLSLRKMNASSKSTGSPSSPTSSLTAHNKKGNRMSQPLSFATLQRNRAKPEQQQHQQLRSSQPNNTINKPKGGTEFCPLPFSSSEERHSEGLRPRLFLYPNNNNFHMNTSSTYNNSSSSTYNTTSCSTDRGLSPTSRQYSNVLNATKNSPLSPTPGTMLRRQHTVEGETLQQAKTFHTPVVRRTMSNMADTLNNNNRVGTMLSKENIGTGTPSHSHSRSHSHSSDMYGGVSRPYETGLNLNTLSHHQTDEMALRSPPSLANFNIYGKSNSYVAQHSKTIDVPSLSSRSNRSVSPAVSPQLITPVSPRVDFTASRPSPNLSSPLLLKDSTNKTPLVQESTATGPRPLFMRDSNITDNPLFSPEKTHSPLERSSSFPSWQRKVEEPPANIHQSPFTQDTVERPDSLSPSRPRGICAPITYSSLRHSPASPTSPAPNSSVLLSQRREDPFSRKLSPPLPQEQSKTLSKVLDSSSRQISSPVQRKNLTKDSGSSIRNFSKPEPNGNLRTGFETSSRHLPSPASQFTFDLSSTERLRSLSKTDSPVTPVSGSTLGSPYSSKEKERSPMTSSSPYESLRSSWYIPSSSSASPSPGPHRLERSSSLGSTLNTLETGEVGSTSPVSPYLHSPYFLLKFSEEKPKAVDLWSTQAMQKQQQRSTMPIVTQGNVNQGPTATQTVLTTQHMSHAKSLESLSPSQLLWSPLETGTQALKLQDDKRTMLRNDTAEQVSRIRPETEKKTQQLDPSVRSTQTERKQESKDVTDAQDQKWSLFLSKTQRDSSSHDKENKPRAQTLERPKKKSLGSPFDVMLDQYRQPLSGKHKDEAALKTEDPCLHHRETLKYGVQPSLKDSTLNSPVSKNMISPGLVISDQVSTKPPKGNKRDESLSKVPQMGEQQNTKNQNQSHRTSYVNQYATLPANWRTKAKGSSNLSNLMDFYKVDTDSVKNFSSTSQPRRTKTTSLSESKNDGLSSNAFDQDGLLHPSLGLLSSQTDIKYGLNQKRSFSVNSVQSSRPSGPGRISRSSSRASSISDLTSLDDLVTLEALGTPDDKHSSKYTSLQIGQSNRSPERIWSPANLEKTSFPWDKDSDPTPPPSPPMSHSPRRLSKGPSSSSPGSRTSPQENLSSPRGHLPSKGYAVNLSVFEESSSDCDSTTDDEYYLDGDGDETEL
ncbi:mucin-2 [Engraulis encrasicolus]|uniref:mucin-2 n=1 Tax=Engraulis encrasicolus TaxID=184585 RepID=UPI002FD46A30